MPFIILVLLFVCVNAHFITACNPNPLQWSVQEKSMYTCLMSKGFSVDQLQVFYNRVFNIATRSGRVSWKDQTMVIDCISRQDFLKYGIIPEPPPPSPAPPSDDFNGSTNYERQVLQCLINKGWTIEQILENNRYTNANTNILTPSNEPIIGIVIDPCLRSQWNEYDQWVYQCLRMKGISNDRVKSYYDRVLNPITRSGRVSVEDQMFVTGCISVSEFEQCGLIVENKEVQDVRPKIVGKNIPSPSMDPIFVIVVDPSSKSKWKEYDKWIYSCLEQKGFNNDQVKSYYDRVLSPTTRSGFVSLEDQNMVTGCITIEEFEQIGLVVEKQEEQHVTLKPGLNIMIDPSLRSQWNERDQWVYQCLKMKKFTDDDQVKDYYDRVLNPITRSGRVSVEDQNLVEGCISIPEFEQCGLIVE